MTVIASRQDIVEANRRRYEELRAAGQEAKPKALPELTALDAAPIPWTAGLGAASAQVFLLKLSYWW